MLLETLAGCPYCTRQEEPIVLWNDGAWQLGVLEDRFAACEIHTHRFRCPACGCEWGESIRLPPWQRTGLTLRLDV